MCFPILSYLQVFLADDVFQNFLIRPIDYLRTPGFRKGLRVIEQELDLQGILVHSPEAFYNVQLIAMRSPCTVEPGFVV